MNKKFLQKTKDLLEMIDKALSIIEKVLKLMPSIRIARQLLITVIPFVVQWLLERS